MTQNNTINTYCVCSGKMCIEKWRALLQKIKTYQKRNIPTITEIEIWKSI
jgi:hypothetical protein